MASQLFKMEKKTDTISSHNIQEIFNLIYVSLVPLRALPNGLSVLGKSSVIFKSLWKEEPAACFIFDSCKEKTHPDRG